MMYHYEASSPYIQAHLSSFSLGVSLTDFADAVDCFALTNQLHQLNGWPIVKFYGKLFMVIEFNAVLLDKTQPPTELIEDLALEVTRVISRHIEEQMHHE